MERNRATPSNLDFATYRHDLRLPDLEDMRVYWHAKMLSAQRYMNIMNENLSLALHLDHHAYPHMLEQDLSKDFSSQRPHIVDTPTDPHLTWSDVIRETNEDSFTEDENGLFSCCIRGLKVQIPANDRRQVSRYYLLSARGHLPQQQHIRIEKETISEVRNIIAHCKKDREEAAKFEEKLDDMLRERDYELGEQQRNLQSSLMSKSSLRSLAFGPTNTIPERSSTRLPSFRAPESPRVFDEPVSRLDRESLPESSIIIIDSDELNQVDTASSQPRTETRLSVPTPARASQDSDVATTQNMPPPASEADKRRGLKPQGKHLITKDGKVLGSEEEKLHSIRFLGFLRARGVPWSQTPAEYARRFQVTRTRGTLEVKYYSSPATTRIGNGCVALSYQSRPRLKKLVQRLWRE